MFSLIPAGLKIVFIAATIIGGLGTLGYCQKQKINRLNKEVKKNSIILDNKLLKADTRNQAYVEERKREIRKTEVAPKEQKLPNEKDLIEFRKEVFKSLKGLK